MSLPTISRSKVYIYWVTVALLAMLATPAFAQTASPASITFAYTYTQSNPGATPDPQYVQVLDTNAQPLAITNAVLTQPTVTPPGGTAQTPAVFVLQQISNTRYLVALNISVIQSPTLNLIALGGSYQGQVIFTTAAGSVTVPITLTINASTVLSATTPATFYATAGGVAPSQVITISSGGIAYSYTASPTVSWITLSATSGVTPATITVTPYASSLSNGTYTGYVNVVAAGSTISVPITLVVGTGSSGLGVSQNTLSYSYASGAVSPTSQTLVLTSSTGATFYTATASTTSGGSWLTLAGSGVVYTTGVFSANVATLLVQASPIGLATGTYSGTVQITASDSSTQSVSVTMFVGTTGGGGTGLVASPTTVAFSAPTLNVSPTAQSVYVYSTTGSTTYTAVATATTGGAWLLVNGTTYATGVLPANLVISANTFGMAAGTYYGTIGLTALGTTTGSQVISVTLTVGSGGTVATSIAPTSLTFSGQVNGVNRPGTQYVALGGTGGSFLASASTSTGSGWLTIPSEYLSGSGPAFIPINVNTTGLAVGTFTGTITITYGGTTTSIPVTLTMASQPAVVTTPGAVFMNAYSTTNVSQSFTVAMSDNSAPAFTASTSAAWLTLSQTSGSLPITLTVTFNPAALASGLNTGTVYITVAGAGNTPLAVPAVLYNLATGTGGGTTNPYFTVTPGSLAFSAQAGQAAATQLLSVTTTSYTGYTFNAGATTTSGGNWLSVNPNFGGIPGTIQVSANATGMSAGTYNGTITISGVGTSTVPVTLTVQGSTVTLNLSSTQVSFEGTEGGTSGSSRAINVQAVGGTTTITTTASTTSGGNWLSVSPGSGAPPLDITITANPAGLTAGTYNGTVTVTPSGGTAHTISVTYTVRANPTVSASPASLTFNYRSGDAAPATQQISVAAQNSTQPLQYTATVATGGSWLSVSPASGSTPGSLNVNVTPGNLDPGNYTGTITVAGSGGAGGSTTITVSITVTAPLPTITRAVNNASYASGAVSPGMIITIAGTNIGPNTPESGGLDSSTNRVVTTLGGVQVLFNGIPGPVLYVSSTQINAIVPYAVSGRLDTFVQVRFRSLTSNTLTMPVTATVPGLYTQNASGSGPAAMLNADGSFNTPGNGAAKGSQVAFYGTGEGITQNANGARPETGQIVNVANINDLPRPLLPVAVLIDGQPATVTYAGSAPGLVAGAFQVNAIVPPTVNSGNVSVQISFGSNSSQSGVTMTVR